MAATLTDLLVPPLESVLTVRLVPDDPRSIEQTTFVEDIASQDGLRPGALAVMSRAASLACRGYHFDVLVRRAAEREIAGLVVRGSTAHSVTAESLARRGRVMILEVDDDIDPMQVFGWLVGAVAGDARLQLARLAAAVAYDHTEASDASDVLTTLSQLTGVDLAQVGHDEPGEPVDIDGRIGASIRANGVGDGPAVAAWVAAATLSRLLTARERETLRPIRSTSGALSQLLVCAQQNLSTVAGRALDAGLHVDGWHCAARLIVNAGDDDAMGTLEQDLVPLVAGLGRDRHGSWTLCRPDSELVAVRTTRMDPGRGSDEFMRGTVEQLLEHVLPRHPTWRVHVGLSTPHEGATGLRTAAEEAKVALASARLIDDPVSIATFDSLGVRRMLAAWVSTDTARDTVADLLAPLDALGAEKGAIAIQTLHAYLDERGSLQRAAQRLNIHRNAVVYRMNQIQERLPNDLADPDQRFALQLACRARLMSLGNDLRH